MVFSEEMLEIKAKLEKLGHQPFVSSFTQAYLGKTESEKEKLTIFHKNEKDAIRNYWAIIQTCDAILVLNYTRRGIENYIGGNSFLEIGFAHVLNKKIYLLNPIPNIEFYKSEIEAMNPVVLYGALEKLA